MGIHLELSRWRQAHPRQPFAKVLRLQFDNTTGVSESMQTATDSDSQALHPKQHALSWQPSTQ
jgi:hypothetical protein